ncbi:MAG TPA: 16S rRNA (guanine(527)-N(7))-methyltransferase RsmG [Clostridiales bacterium]|nr:16S rRNA (guanine(527)-N(7))-methyltransferase RsmG [Clostridiales bacterium]
MKNRNFLEEMLKEIKITLSSKQLEQLDFYYDLIIEKNKVMNLTAITDYNEVVIKHFVDSLSLVGILDLNDVTSVIDIGTGAGFPGIPLKIVFPHLNIVLLDSLNKRVKFLKDVITELDLNKNNASLIKAIHARAEDLAHNDEYREGFDLCVSRAVANLSTLSEYCLPFVKPKGSFISYKASNMQEELEEAENAIKILGGKIVKIDSFHLPNTDMERRLIKIDKISSTPKKYPRNAGTPKREPIQ